MQTKELVARTLVQKEDEQEYLLEYYILENLSAGGALDHGIEIKMNHNNAFHSALAYVPGGKNDILSLIELYAKHSVMPVSLNDLIEDLSFQGGPSSSGALRLSS